MSTPAIRERDPSQGEARLTSPTPRPVVPRRRAGRSAFRWALVLGVLLAPGFILPQYPLYVASLTLIYVMAAVGLNLVLGYAGQISLAQSAMLGIGAYTVALTQGEVPYVAAIVLAGVIGFVVGLVLGLPSLRVKHHYLAMVTLGFQVIFVLVVLNEEEITGGALGLAGVDRPSIGPLALDADYAFYLFIAAVCFVVLFAVHWLLNSQWARAFKGIRFNERRAASVGVDVRTYKLLAFAIGSAIAAVAGSLFAGLIGYVDPTSFSITLSLQFLLMVVLGGLGRFEGAVIGAVVVAGVPEVLRVSQDQALIFFGAGGLLALVFMPDGLVTLSDWFFERVLRRPRPRLTK